MSTQLVSNAESSIVALKKVADYLSRPQQFLAVGEARAELRQTLEEASRHSVVLTNNGLPQAAIVPFETLEAIRSALLQLLVGEMQASFERLQQNLLLDSSQRPPEPTTEDELESLVRQARRSRVKTNSAKRRRR
ncbi:MAG: hypothetical protein SF339_16830 [Blastocatellia bacterium]|nr:hypothetical protein [Blastocatellia bacterium]